MSDSRHLPVVLDELASQVTSVRVDTLALLASSERRQRHRLLVLSSFLAAAMVGGAIGLGNLRTNFDSENDVATADSPLKSASATAQSSSAMATPTAIGSSIAGSLDKAVSVSPSPTAEAPADPILHFIEHNPGWIHRAVSSRSTRSFCAYIVLGTAPYRVFVYAHCTDGTTSSAPAGALHTASRDSTGPVVGFEIPRDGTLYGPDLARIFPQTSRTKLEAVTNNQREALKAAAESRQRASTR